MNSTADTFVTMSGLRPLWKGFQIHQLLTQILDSDEQGGVQEAPSGVFSSSVFTSLSPKNL